MSLAAVDSAAPEDGASLRAPRRAEARDKVNKVRDLLRRRGLGAVALSSRRNFAWLTAGGDNHVAQDTQTGVATIVVTPTGAAVISPINESAHLHEEELADLDFEAVMVPWEDPAAVEHAVRALAGRHAYIVRDDALEADLVGLRSRLTEREQDAMAAAGTLAASAVTSTFLQVVPGESERQVAARLIGHLATRGLNAPVLLVASDERIARYRHPIPTRQLVRSSLMIVLVAERQGLHVALTRTGWLDGRPDAETLRRNDACNAIDAAFRAATVPGRSLADVLTTGVAAYAAAGFPDEPRLHHQGGTIAYQPREVLATPSATERVDTSMAFAWNPSITGAKAEDTFILTAGGPGIITRDLAWPRSGDGAPAIWIAAPA